MKTYKEIKVTTIPFDADIVSGMLWQLDIDGVNEFDEYLTVFITETKKTTLKDVEEILQRLVDEKLIESFQTEEQIFAEKNWNEEYEKKVRVVEVTDRIVIKPSFKEYFSKPEQLVLTIDPKMSFGTGEHATTKLVLQHLEKHVHGGEKVLDIGSGTGVLGIASVMLGASNAICIDNDEWCLLNGIENVKTNNLANKIEVRQCELKDVKENDFDLIVANINKHILIDIAELITSKIKKTGTLILSGLLDIDEADIIGLYASKGFKLQEQSVVDEWIAIVLKS
ncbi:MAG: 50S ribosomal protein L11 methyltransferase [Ignavibacteria bacterium]|nr:MAG: 50S ribosomal protein L11 methyltransferase [Ignavibacteria bacterium]KAF0160817.1 MAG: 50S ribosomal protein L11 methyltransferase [Ignavibacteria bacterium]